MRVHSWAMQATTLVLPSLVILAAYARRSLDVSGAVAGWFVGATCSMAGGKFSTTLIAFFVTSSLLTKMGAKSKKAIDADYKDGGQRNWVQVLSNGLGGTIACLCIVASRNYPDNFRSIRDPEVMFEVAFLSHFACCCGDTWASETGTAFSGPLSESFLLTSLRRVPRGTNGGISVIGTLASLLGGCFVGLVFALCGSSLTLPSTIIVGAAAGLGGSLLDSLLGATLQYSGISNSPGPGVKHVSGSDVLDNHQVNLVSSLVTSMTAAALVHLL
ncbi:hypothetical protein GUITHDRAFT_106634 [Guillardia theta CCMP2712]|uniref:Transmembrane protein 19 n=1 Tax=Guillardia theta (strain CCMP2712) TaxID=905079 RepID=L1JGL6_GUITC|nr:hypothetical protein GUITHDRAFT_106634 [Guillardia theta CCMP2712]EKX47646.1 hypothetical protein GUITHDRAFT_106634 [Guillardia theta CCMP2712]|eukprot:XP_005834626.1 hypothetical protein GUITHDRAFT_106634 [Guillardia theta CCMP2712]